MKKVLFDQNVPRPLARLLIGYEVKRAAELGWSRLTNGVLLAYAEEAGFNLLLSGDKTIHYEQNMTGRKIALVCMSDNHWPIVRDYVSAILQALEQAAPGEVLGVHCGTFPSRRPRRPSLPI